MGNARFCKSCNVYVKTVVIITIMQANEDHIFFHSMHVNTIVQRFLALKQKKWQRHQQNTKVNKCICT